MTAKRRQHIKTDLPCRLTELCKASRPGYSVYQCSCPIGTIKEIRRGGVANGTTRSCGCLRDELIRARGFKNRRHGLTGSRTYHVWAGMLARCHNPNDRGWAHYGGRGITVCEVWRASIDAFVADVGECPSAKHSIDRIDNDGNYEPGNVRWATSIQQNNNKRGNRRYTVSGTTGTVTELARQYGLAPHVVFLRLRTGYSIEEALTRPLRITKRTP